MNPNLVAIYPFRNFQSSGARELELECAHPLGARPTQTPGTSGGKRVGPGSVRLAVSATAMNRLLEIQQRLLEAAGACGNAEGSSEETFCFTKENGGGTVNPLDFLCHLSSLQSPRGSCG